MQWTDRRTNILLVVLLFLFAAVVIPGLWGFGPYTDLFKRWASHVHGQGLKKAYLPADNAFGPTYQYVLWLYGKLCGTDRIIGDRIGYLRLFTIAAEMLGIYYASLWNNRKVPFSILLLLTMFNVGFSYTTFVCGQLDGMLAAFVFIAIYHLYVQKLLPGLLWFTAAVLLRAEALLFVPIIIFLLLFNRLNKVFSRQVMLAVVGASIFSVVLCSPFLLMAESRQHLLASIWGNEDGGQFFISNRAFNIYYWVFEKGGGEITRSRDDAWISGISYHHFGWVLSWVFSGLAILPVLRFATSKKTVAGLISVFPREKIWIICSLLPLIVFFFATGMQMQYAHAAILFLLVYAFNTGDMFPYIMFSIAHFLNMENVMQWLRLANYGTLIFDARFVSAIYFVIILYLFVRLFTARQPKLTAT